MVPCLFLRATVHSFSYKLGAHDFDNYLASLTCSLRPA